MAKHEAPANRSNNTKDTRLAGKPGTGKRATK